MDTAFYLSDLNIDKVYLYKGDILNCISILINHQNTVFTIENSYFEHKVCVQIDRPEKVY